jgi:hypothetical protein
MSETRSDLNRFTRDITKEMIDDAVPLLRFMTKKVTQRFNLRYEEWLGDSYIAALQWSKRWNDGEGDIDRGFMNFLCKGIEYNLLSRIRPFLGISRKGKERYLYDKRDTFKTLSKACTTCEERELIQILTPLIASDFRMRIAYLHYILDRSLRDIASIESKSLDTIYRILPSYDVFENQVLKGYNESIIRQRKENSIRCQSDRGRVG